MADLPLKARVEADLAGTILLLLDDEAERENAVRWLEELGYGVIVAHDLGEARALLGRRLDIDVAVCDVGHARGATSVLQAVAEAPAGVALVLVGPPDVFLATQAMAAGVRSYLAHPLSHADLVTAALEALRAARRVQLAQERALALPREVRFEGLVGATPRMHEVMELLRKAAPTDAPIVITGESGTGKELVARAVHESSHRRAGPFVALHLHATPEGLIESELFGHKKGAYTGALADRTGKLEQAHGGTLFLDELGDIPLETQTKLLRVLETRQFEPLGSNRTVSADFRLITATNQDIDALIAEKKFREELWFRLKVIRVELPPLRERRADIPLLVERFVREYAQTYGKPVEGLEADALSALTRHAWRGNIRELRNVVHHMVVLADGPRLRLRDVPRELRGGAAAPEAAAAPPPTGLAGRTMDEIERDAIKATLELTQGNRKAAADLLQIGERTLYRKIERFGL